MRRVVYSSGGRVPAPAHSTVRRLGRTLWCLPTVVIAVMLIGLSGLADAAVKSSQEIGYHFIHRQDDWTVRWQARTSNDKGAFRLYAGQDLPNLRVVDLQQANAGNGSYQYKDMSEGLVRVFYQLRYVSNDGEEIVLGTLRIDLGGMEKSPATIDSGGGASKALHESRPHLALISTPGTPAGSKALPEAAPPEPEVPPPRPTV